MSSFDNAINVLLKFEGGYVNDPEDSGRETNFGISKKSYPNLNIKDLKRDEAIAIYKKDWWLTVYNQIEVQEIATKVFVCAVNMGAKNAHICIQKAVRAANGIILNLDAVLGSDTLKAINACNSGVLLSALKAEAAAYYRLLVIQDPTKEKFISGWLNRAYS